MWLMGAKAWLSGPDSIVEGFARATDRFMIVSFYSYSPRCHEMVFIIS